MRGLAILLTISLHGSKLNIGTARGHERLAGSITLTSWGNLQVGKVGKA